MLRLGLTIAIAASLGCVRTVFDGHASSDPRTLTTDAEVPAPPRPGAGSDPADDAHTRTFGI